MLILLLALMNASPEEPSVLEFSGKSGISFFGFCITKESGERKEIAGVTPGEITLDANIQRCSIKKKDSKANLKIRLFHKKKLISEQDLSGPTSGIDLVIPF